MARNVQTIKIESILGGQSPTSHFAASDQFLASAGIDPSAPRADTGTYNFRASGLLKPTPVVTVDDIGGGMPLWMKVQPKSKTVFVYDHAGSVYSINSTISTVTGIGDLNDGGTARGNGMEYYDNYIYFSRSTTIARYGPLDGTPAFTDDYWTGTLGLTALSDTNYPQESGFSNLEYPNHVLHRHSNGKMYIADVVDNQGTIHYVQTKKTTVEGDTNNGSTYDALSVGYGLWPSAIESYGESLVFAFFEGPTGSGAYKGPRAKVAFWDTTSKDVNSITWVEFPDAYISSIKNLNGVLYFFSGNPPGLGMRVSRYVGGSSFEEVQFFEYSEPPMPGAVEAVGSQLMFGSLFDLPVVSGNQGCVFSYGLQSGALGQGLFNIMRSSGNAVTALCIPAESGNIGFVYPVIGTSDGQIEKKSSSGYAIGAGWWSQIYRIGQPFKITKIRIPFAQDITSGMSITPSIYTDSGDGTTFTLTTINNTNYSGVRNVVFRSDSSTSDITGQNDFWLSLEWTGDTLCTVSLPIVIEYELIDD